MSIVFVNDATHQNISAIPKGILAALYTTGSPDIKATADDFKNHPNAIRICQDHGSDPTADIIDMETGAATPNDAVTWLKNARASFNANDRPGQRWPGIYAQQSRITEMANALVTAHDTNVPLWVAHWGVSEANADSVLLAATGPFPIVGMQIANQGTKDFSVFSSTYLDRRSGMPPVTQPVIEKVPPGQWKDSKEWAWEQASVIGIGLDGKLHAFAFNPTNGTWTKVL